MTDTKQPEATKREPVTMYDLFRAWCRDIGLDPADSASMKLFLAEVFDNEAGP